MMSDAIRSDDEGAPRPEREPAFLLLCLLHAVLNWVPIQGITIWYDEAWRLLCSVTAGSWQHFFTRWSAHGLPMPICIPHLLLIKVVHGALGLPASEYILRCMNVLASFLVLRAAWIFTARWSRFRMAGFAATALIAVNPYFGYHVFSIKEHVMLVALIALWACRLQRLVIEDRSTTYADVLICWGMVIFSPLAASALGVAIVALFAAGWTGRKSRRDLPLLFAGMLPAAVLILAQLRCASLLERDLELFCVKFGLESLPPGSLYGGDKTDLTDLMVSLLHLGGARPGSMPFMGLAATVWLIVPALAIARAIVKQNRSSVLILCATLLAPATMLFFQVTTGVSAPRMVLWLAPAMAIAAAAVLFDASSPMVWPRRLLFAILFVSTGLGWLHWWHLYPQKIRYHAFVENLGELSFDRERDIVLHTQGLLYYPHAVFDPTAPKATFPLPEEGTAMMTLHRECPNRYCVGMIPRADGSLLDPQWTDSELRSFGGDAVWGVTNYTFSPALTRHVQENFHPGETRTDTWVDWPFCWIRVGKK